MDWFLYDIGLCHERVKVPCPLLSESVVCLQDHNKECPLTTFEQFSERGFGEVCGKRLTASAYMELNV